MKKKLFILLTTLTMLFIFGAASASAASSGTCGTNLTWTLDDAGTLTISGTGEMYSEAFRNNSNIKTVIIKNGVTSIGSSAFYNCRGLTAVTIPDSVTSIGRGAFSGCSVTSVTIPDSVTSIEDEAFYNCSGLMAVTIPDSVTSIGDGAFRGCSGLTAVNVDEKNKNYSSIDSVLFNKNKTKLIQYPIGNGRTSYSIPDSVTSIGNGAFYYCRGLTSVKIPNSVTSIGKYAFEYCSGLTEVTIPNSVTSIGKYAFEYCSGLTAVTIPDSVTSIGDWAFADCSGLTEVTIPNSVTSMGSNAFRRCYSLTRVQCNARKVTNAFVGLYNLTFVFLGRNVETIDTGAFDGCSNLQRVLIPISVTEIEANAFSGCTGLTTIEYGGSEADWQDIYIGSGNDVLSNVNITYNSPLRLKSTVIKQSFDDTRQFTVTPDIPVSDSIVYAAVYDDRGIITSTACVPLNMSGSTVVNTAKTDMDKTAKIFVWDSKMQPIAAVKDLDNLDIDDVVLESEHPYANNTDKAYTYTYSGDCESIDVTFSSDTATESGYDYIYIYDANGTQIGSYTGTALAGKTVNVPGNTIKIRIISDVSGAEYGFKTESIVVNR